MKGSYRTKDGKAQIDWALEQKEFGLEFTASGEYDGSMGQNIGTIAAAYPHDEMVQRIARVWSKWHLNGMKPGLPEQEAALAITPADWTYAERVQYLKDAGLYELPVPAGVQAIGGFPDDVTRGQRGYRYGERWVFAPLPPEVLAEIQSWGKQPQPAESLHEARAKQFLAEHGLRFRATLSDSKLAPFEPSGHHYRVTISRERVKGSRLVFDFWGSWHDMAHGKRDLRPYDVLACLSSDATCPETFGDFCATYGLDPDSIKAKQAFRRSARFAERLREFFTPQEIEAMQSIC